MRAEEQRMADIRSQVGFALMDPAFLRDVMDERRILPAPVPRTSLSGLCSRVGALAARQWLAGVARYSRRS
jgi:hypothetical protein